jgi:outer membrane biogenesis lipoprotein LolB
MTELARVFSLSFWLFWLGLGVCGFFSRAVAEDFTDTQNFWLDARLSIKTERFGEPVQQLSGRLLWRHGLAINSIRFFSPFGQMMAELNTLSDQNGSDGLVKARLADGRQFQAASLDELALQSLGYSLPFEALPDWLVGKGSMRSIVLRDDLHRPIQLTEGVWQVRYRYQADNQSPISIQVSSEEGITLRLLIDRWLNHDEAFAESRGSDFVR